MAKIVIETDDLVSVPEAAKLLGRPKMTIYRWIEKDIINAIDLCGVVCIPKKEIERLKDQK